jgi:hypothetical protein
MSWSFTQYCQVEMSCEANGAAQRNASFQRLLLLRADPLEVLDLQRGLPALFGDLAVLLHDEGAGRLVAVEAAEQLRGHAPVGALGAVFIEDVEEGEFAFGICSGFFGHGGLVVDQGAIVN